jgi:hypothetical protein
MLHIKILVLRSRVHVILRKMLCNVEHVHFEQCSYMYVWVYTKIIQPNKHVYIYILVRDRKVERGGNLRREYHFKPLPELEVGRVAQWEARRRCQL